MRKYIRKIPIIVICEFRFTPRRISAGLCNYTKISYTVMLAFHLEVSLEILTQQLFQLEVGAIIF